MCTYWTLRGDSGRRIYLQLKTADFYEPKQGRDGKDIFTINNPHHTEQWKSQADPVMLVTRAADGQIRWMDVTDYLREQRAAGKRFVTLALHNLQSSSPKVRVNSREAATDRPELVVVRS